MINETSVNLLSIVFSDFAEQEEFVCEPPMITRHTSKMFVMEGQEVSLRCKSIGDPEPSTHWVSPDGKLIGNTSRTVCYENGSLDILKASVKVREVIMQLQCHRHNNKQVVELFVLIM